MVARSESCKREKEKMDSAKGNYVTNTIVPPLREERMERREERGRGEELRQTTLPAWTHNMTIKEENIFILAKQPLHKTTLVIMMIRTILQAILVSASVDAFAPAPSLRCRLSRPIIQPTQSIRYNKYTPSTSLSLQQGEKEAVSMEDEVQDIQLPNIFTKHERPQDITTESFGPLLPIAKAVDDATGGWGLSYADLHPATPRTR